MAGSRRALLPPAHIYALCRQMANLFGQFLSKRKTISSASSDEIIHFFARNKKTQAVLVANASRQVSRGRNNDSSFSMTQDVGATLQAILAKLEKLDSIESAVKKIEANLEKLENRT